MEELRQLAFTYHAAATKEVQEVVEEFFKEMDPDDHGCVEFEEFSAYMEAIGCQNLSSKEFFDLLKQPGNEELYAEDVITLFYIINSGRPFCGGKCRKFVEGMYFTCVKCFDGSGSTFSVCPVCFDGGQYEHHHEEFLDPIVLLRVKRMEALMRSNTNQTKYETSTSSASTVVMNPRSTSSSAIGKSETSNSISPIVPEKCKQAKMQTVIQFGQLIASLGSVVVATQCTIM
ncbi:hypothetical protein UlMin_010145 [Ulmus minor]